MYIYLHTYARACNVVSITPSVRKNKSTGKVEVRSDAFLISTVITTSGKDTLANRTSSRSVSRVSRRDGGSDGAWSGKGGGGLFLCKSVFNLCFVTVDRLKRHINYYHFDFQPHW